MLPDFISKKHEIYSGKVAIGDSLRNLSILGVSAVFLGLSQTLKKDAEETS